VALARLVADPIAGSGEPTHTEGFLLLERCRLSKRRAAHPAPRLRPSVQHGINAPVKRGPLGSFRAAFLCERALF
jgi:hypothetical protein